MSDLLLTGVLDFELSTDLNTDIPLEQLHGLRNALRGDDLERLLDLQSKVYFICIML